MYNTDRRFYGDLHEMSDILIMLLISVESDKILKQLYKKLKGYLTSMNPSRQVTVTEATYDFIKNQSISHIPLTTYCTS